MEQIFYDLDAPVARVGAFDVPFPAASLRTTTCPSLKRVMDAVRKTLRAEGLELDEGAGALGQRLPVDEARGREVFDGVAHRLVNGDLLV